MKINLFALITFVLFLTLRASAQLEILDYSTLVTADTLCEYDETDLDCYRDSLKIFGKIYRPLTPYSHRMPVVIHAHGYNSSHGEPEPYAKGLAKSGYANVIFDFCGGGNGSRSDGKTTDMSVFTEQRDVEAIIDLLSTYDWVDTEHIYLMGYSQGGLVSAITAAANPDRIAGLILVYPALLIPDHARNIHPKEAWTAESYPVMGMNLSHVYYDRLLDYDVYEDVKKYKGPVSIIYGDKDSVTAFRSMERADSAFTKVEFHVIKDGTHGFPPSEHKIATINHALDFLVRNAGNAHHRYMVPPTNIDSKGYPRINPDLSVDFRVNAPEAGKVQVDLCGKKYDLVRGASGIWSGTTDPQVPGFHYYYLVVDGVSVADPASESFYGCGRMSSAIDVPEPGCDVFETTDVPHGQVRQLNYYSDEAGSWRPVFVYTPPSYESGDASYPVIYIHHGGGEDHRGWMQQGRMANIMDNLIATGKVREAIVVSPNSNVPGAGGYSQAGMQAYARELTENIIPFIERTFRVASGAENRAMCGLSMGGGQSFYIGLARPDLFRNIGIFSSGIFGGIVGAALDLEKEIPGILSDTAAFNNGLDVLYISCGEQDPRISHTRQYVGIMKDAGVDVVFNSFPGDHEWQVWRKSFADFVPLLFKK